MPDCGDAIDPLTFEQILEMDDDDSREFSREIVFGFFDQATSTFKSMHEALYGQFIPPFRPKVRPRADYLSERMKTLSHCVVSDTI